MKNDEYCEVCGEEPCECAELAAQCEAEEREWDLMFWRHGGIDWHERANAPGFSMWRYLRLRFDGARRLEELSSRETPFIRKAAANL